MNTASVRDINELMSEARGLRFKNPEAAHRVYANAVERCREAQLHRELIEALKGLGQIERDLSNPRVALPLYKEAVALCREQEDALLLAHTVRHVGDIHQDLERDELAASCYEEALVIYRANKETQPLDLANTIRPFALLKENAGETEEAKRLWAEARDLYAASNIKEGVAECSRRLTRLENG